jgi:hypothetical protein
VGGIWTPLATTFAAPSIFTFSTGPDDSSEISTCEGPSGGGTGEIASADETFAALNLGAESMDKRLPDSNILEQLSLDEMLPVLSPVEVTGGVDLSPASSSVHMSWLPTAACSPTSSVPQIQQDSEYWLNIASLEELDDSLQPSNASANGRSTPNTPDLEVNTDTKLLEAADQVPHAHFIARMPLVQCLHCPKKFGSSGPEYR